MRKLKKKRRPPSPGLNTPLSPRPHLTLHIRLVLGPDPHGRDAARPRQVPAPSRREAVQGQLPSLGPDLPVGRRARDLHGVEPDAVRVLGAGRLQVRLVRVLQEEVLRPRRPRERVQVQDRAVPDRLRVRRVPRRSGAVSVRGCEGPHADYDSAPV